MFSKICRVWRKGEITEIKNFFYLTLKIACNIDKFCYNIINCDANMAQLVEQLIRNQQVAGSNPAISSTILCPLRTTLKGHNFKWVFK